MKTSLEILEEIAQLPVGLDAAVALAVLYRGDPDIAHTSRFIQVTHSPLGLFIANMNREQCDQMDARVMAAIERLKGESNE